MKEDYVSKNTKGLYAFLWYWIKTIFDTEDGSKVYVVLILEEWIALKGVLKLHKLTSLG